MNEDSEQKSMQLRALLAFALSAVILFVYQYFVVKPAPRPPVAPETKSAPATAPATPAQKQSTSAQPLANARGSEAPVQAAEAEQSLVIETDTYLVALSNHGAVATSWTLKRYKDESGRPLELVNTTAAPEAGYPFSFVLRENGRQAELNQALFQVETSGASSGGRLTAPVTLTFRWSDGNLTARKTFRFEKNSYLVGIESQIEQGGAVVPHMLAWRGGFGDAGVADAARSVKTFYYDTAQSKVIRLEAKAADKGPALNSGNYLFVGIEDKYFAAAFLTGDAGRQIQLETTAVQAATSRESKKQLFAGAAVGGMGENSFRVFVGPKVLDVLRSIQPQLASIIDFGFFSFLAYPLFLILNWVHRLGIGLGWTIILVTVAINFILFPLKLKSMQSMKKMQKLQPLVKQINEKYKSLPLRDPRRQDQNKEMMDLYGKYGVNPLGGCLPMVLQLPFFFAFYTVLTVSIEMRHAPWLWVRDLSSPEHLAIKVLPLLMIATQFWYQKMTPATTVDPAQQKMMQFMPLVMGFFFYNLSSGLVLYWLTGNLVGIAQQWFINRLPEPELEAQMAKAVRSRRKAGR